jgi:hypothetical protein
MATSPRPPGRPRHNADGLKRRPLTLHTTDGLKNELIKAAKASGRSLTQEVEYRLARSLSEDHNKPEAEILVDNILFELRERVMLVVSGYRGAPGAKQSTPAPVVVSAEPERKSKSRRR